MPIPHEEDYRLVIDDLWTTRQKRLTLQKEVDELQEEEYRLMAFLTTCMDGDGLNEAQGTHSKVTTKLKRKPVVENWSELNQFIIRTGQIDLLHQRLKESAVAERWQLGDGVPGVTYKDYTAITITGLKK